jgi:hypothetical protein
MTAPVRQRVRLDAVAIDAGTQVRAAIDEATVTHYAERMTAGDVFPAIVLFHDGTQHHLADGFHRVLAAQRIQWRELDAEVRPGTKADAIWFALAANRANGKPMTGADKRHAIVLALQTWPDRSTRMIAAQIGCDQSFVVKVRPQVMTDSSPARVTGKDGKSYPASRTPVRRPPEERRDQIAELASKGYSTRQIAGHLGIGEERVAVLAQHHAVEIRADLHIGRTRRLDGHRIIERTVYDAEHLTAEIALVDFAELDPARLAAWIVRMEAAQKAISAFVRQLKKAVSDAA